MILQNENNRKKLTNKKKIVVAALSGLLLLASVWGLTRGGAETKQLPSVDPAASAALPVITNAIPQPEIITPAANENNSIPAIPSLDAKAFLLMDYASGQVLASNQSELRLEPASITKMMTSYVVSAELKAGKIKIDEPVLISENAWRGGGGGTDGSTSFMPLNEKVPLKDLLYGMIIQSGNDASIALAEHVAGDESSFATMMNAQARRLGLNGTHFVNATGLSNPDHYSTALDIAKLSQALIRDFPEEYSIYAIKEFAFNNITQHNRNQLLWRDATVDGIKTGHHSAAGFCLAASSKRGDMRLISVVLGSSSEKSRADASQSLLNYGFRFFESHAVFRPTQIVESARIWKGEIKQIQLGVGKDAIVTMQRGAYARLKARAEVNKPLVAPVAQGQELGALKIELDGKVIYEAPLIANQAVAEAGFFARLWDSFWMWWGS